MKWLLAVFSFASACGLLLAAPDRTAQDGSELADDIRQRQVRSFDGGQNFNTFFGQGLASQKGNTMVNWNSLLSKKKRQMEFYPGNGFNQGLGGNGLQDWSHTFGRDDRSFGQGNKISTLGSSNGRRFDEDGMQNWRAFYSRFSRKRRSSNDAINPNDS